MGKIVFGYTAKMAKHSTPVNPFRVPIRCKLTLRIVLPLLGLGEPKNTVVAPHGPLLNL